MPTAGRLFLNELCFVISSFNVKISLAVEMWEFRLTPLTISNIA